MIERECDNCGERCSAPKYAHCSCGGTMCAVIRRVRSKMVVGVLYRDEVFEPYPEKEICFVLGALLLDEACMSGGLWYGDAFTDRVYHSWTKEEWQEQFGKLPRKGSKEAVMLELSNA